MGLHLQLNINEVLQAFLVGLVCGSTSLEITQVEDEFHQSFLLGQIFWSKVILPIYIYNIPYKKVTLCPVLGKHINAFFLHYVPNSKNRNVSFR